MLSCRTRLYSLYYSNLFVLIVIVLLLWLVYYQSLYIAQKYDLVYIVVVGEPLYSLEVRLSIQQQQESLCIAQKYDLACRSSSRRASIRPRSMTQHVTVVVGELLYSLEVRPSILQQYKSLCTAQKYDLACGGSRRASIEPLYSLEVRPGILQQQESLCTAQKYDLVCGGGGRASVEPLYGLEVRPGILWQQESLCIAQKYDLAYSSSRRASVQPRSITWHVIVRESLYTAQKYDLVYSSSRKASVRPRSTTQHIIVVAEPLYSLEA